MASVSSNLDHSFHLIHVSLLFFSIFHLLHLLKKVLSGSKYNGTRSPFQTWLLVMWLITMYILSPTYWIPSLHYRLCLEPSSLSSTIEDNTLVAIHIFNYPYYLGLGRNTITLQDLPDCSSRSSERILEVKT